MRRRRHRHALPEPDGTRVNDAIHVPRVIVVDTEGKRLGEFMTRDAVQDEQIRLGMPADAWPTPELLRALR